MREINTFGLFREGPPEDERQEEPPIKQEDIEEIIKEAHELILKAKELIGTVSKNVGTLQKGIHFLKNRFDDEDSKIGKILTEAETALATIQDLLERLYDGIQKILKSAEEYSLIEQEVNDKSFKPLVHIADGIDIDTSNTGLTPDTGNIKPDHANERTINPAIEFNPEKEETIKHTVEFETAKAFRQSIDGIDASVGFNALYELDSIILENADFLGEIGINSSKINEKIESIKDAINNSDNYNDALEKLHYFVMNKMPQITQQYGIRSKLEEIIQAIGDQIDNAENNRRKREENEAENSADDEKSEAQSEYKPQSFPQADVAKAINTIKKENEAKLAGQKALIANSTSFEQLKDIVNTSGNILQQSDLDRINNQIARIPEMIIHRVPLKNIALQFPAELGIQDKIAELVAKYAESREKTEIELRIQECTSIDDLSIALNEIGEIQTLNGNTIDTSVILGELNKAIRILEGTTNYAIEALVQKVPKYAGIREKSIELLRKIQNELKIDYDNGDDDSLPDSSQNIEEIGDDPAPTLYTQQEPQKSKNLEDKPTTETNGAQTNHNLEDTSDTTKYFDKITYEKKDLANNAGREELYAPGYPEYIIASWITGEKIDREIGTFTTRVREVMNNMVPEFMEVLEEAESPAEIKQKLLYAWRDTKIINAIKLIQP